MSLLGFNNARAGRMAPFAHARRAAVSSRGGELPGVHASAAAAVGYRTKASGRRVGAAVPRGRVASALSWGASSPATTRARSRAARRAARWARP